MSRKLFPALPLLLALWGCSQPQAAPLIVPPSTQPYQRFVPIQQDDNVAGVLWSGAFALDTKTGQLCETYALDITRARSSEAAWLAGIPQCSALYKKFPD